MVPKVPTPSPIMSVARAEAWVTKPKMACKYAARLTPLRLASLCAQPEQSRGRRAGADGLAVLPRERRAVLCATIV